DVQKLDSGCCGMAGSFGFEQEKYNVSVACGERVLLPAVRLAPHDTLIIADGFSCREQIAQLTGRRALHTAEVLRMALRDGPRGPLGSFPEERVPRERHPSNALAGTVAVAAAITGAAAVWRWLQSRNNRNL